MDNEKKVDILGTNISRVRTEEVLEEISESLSFGKKLFIVTTNPEGVMLADKDNEFKQIVNSSNLAIADGVGILWAAKVLSFRTSKTFFRFLEIPFLALVSLLSIIFYPSYIKRILKEQIRGSDLFWEIVHKTYEMDKSIYLLGGREGIAEKVKDRLEKKLSGIKISGLYSGSPKESGLVEKINQTETNILFVAWGQPKQEKWIYENLDKLNINVAIGIGGTFDFVAGTIKRSPKFIQKIGLEWLWRLFKEPKRIGRIFTAVPRFIFSVIDYKMNIRDKQ